MLGPNTFKHLITFGFKTAYSLLVFQNVDKQLSTRKILTRGKKLFHWEKNAQRLMRLSIFYRIINC